MNRTLLGILGVALALTCWSVLLIVRHNVFGIPLTNANIVFELALVGAGSAFFWAWIIRLLNRQAAEVRQHTQHLKTLHEASVALTTEHDLHTVLQKVVDLSRELLHAHYGALGLLNENGDQINHLVTSGISAAGRARMQHLPIGDGILGLPMKAGGSIRIDSLADDPRATGFPANHPAMRSFLGVPIISKGHIFGNLYLTDKLPDPDTPQLARRQNGILTFTQEDQDVLEMFATQAAIAIENAQLYRENQQIAVMRERERFGMDLHDGVIQSIYAIGLMLDDTQHRLPAEPDLARERISAAIHSLNSVIRDIRSYINDLRSQRADGRSLQQGVEFLAGELRAAHIEISLSLDANAVIRFTPSQTKEILHVLQEALSNIRKHTGASAVRIELSDHGDFAELSVIDNGRGFSYDSAAEHSGHGLRNMHARARVLHGSLTIVSTPGAGACVTLSLPFPGPQPKVEDPRSTI